MSAASRGGRLAAIVFAALVCGMLVIAAAASAATRATLSASASKSPACHTKFVGDRAHTDVVRVTSTAEGLLRARLKSRGDWDLGVFDAKSKRYVAGSAALRGNELAEGFVTKGSASSCRLAASGAASRVRAYL